MSFVALAILALVLFAFARPGSQPASRDRGPAPASGQQVLANMAHASRIVVERAWSGSGRVGLQSLLSSTDPLPGVGSQVVQALNRVTQDIARPLANTDTEIAQAMRQLDSDQFPYRDVARRAAARYAVDLRLVLAIIALESKGDPAAVSPAGAIGLMQLTPETAVQLGIDPWDPVQNIDGAVRYLASLMSTFRSLDLTLVAYNAWAGFALRYKNGSVPLVPETQSFVQRVSAAVR